MASKLKSLFPMIRTQEEILKEIRESLLTIMEELNRKLQELEALGIYGRY